MNSRRELLVVMATLGLCTAVPGMPVGAASLSTGVASSSGISTDAKAPPMAKESPGTKVSWVAETLKAHSRTPAAELIAGGSAGAQRWSGSGACTVVGSTRGTSRVWTVKTARSGTCRLNLTIARNGTAPAVSMSRVLTVSTPVTVNVLAAASLTSAFSTIATEFMLRRRHVEVVPSFAGSATLVRQIQQGAPFDVVALADESSMNSLVASDDVAGSGVTIFATNRLAIITAKGNPLGLKTIADLARRSVDVSLCDAAQPCGKYAARLFMAAGVAVTPATLETSASGVIGRVSSGEVDAGLAYASDGATHKNVSVVAIPAGQNVVARYPIALSTTSSRERTPETTRYMSFVLSARGKKILSAAGFTAP